LIFHAIVISINIRKGIKKMPHKNKDSAPTELKWWGDWIFHTGVSHLPTKIVFLRNFGVIFPGFLPKQELLFSAF